MMKPTRLALLFIVLSSFTQDPDRQLRDWSASGQTEAVRKLLAESETVDVCTRDDLGWTPLMYAAEAGHTEIVALLIDAGANVHSEDNDSATALHLAAEKGRTEVTRILLKAGADFEARDDSDRTPLYRAFENRHGEITELLQEAAMKEVDRRASVETGRVRQDTHAPKLIESFPAEYTNIGLKRGIEGTVVLMILVRRDGTVGPVSVSEGLEESLDQSARRTVRKWKFEPATRAGSRVEAIMEAKMDFKLPTEP